MNQRTGRPWFCALVVIAVAFVPTFVAGGWLLAPEGALAGSPAAGVGRLSGGDGQDRLAVLVQEARGQLYLAPIALTCPGPTLTTVEVITPAAVPITPAGTFTYDGPAYYFPSDATASVLISIRLHGTVTFASVAPSPASAVSATVNARPSRGCAAFHGTVD